MSQKRILRDDLRAPGTHRHLFLLPDRKDDYFMHLEGEGPVPAAPEPGDIIIETSRYSSGEWIIRQWGNGIIGKQHAHNADF